MPSRLSKIFKCCNTVAYLPPSLRFRIVSRLGILGCPFLGRGNRGLFVLLPALCDVGSKRVVGVGRAEKGLDGQQNCSNLQGRGPVVFEENVSVIFVISTRRFWICEISTFQNIETDATELVDVGVEDFCEETDLWGCHGVVFGQKQLELENATCGSVARQSCIFSYCM